MNNNIITSVILLVGLALLNTGKILWERVAHKGIPKSKRHTKSTKANCTPATDAKYLIVNFGSKGYFVMILKES